MRHFLVLPLLALFSVDAWAQQGAPPVAPPPPPGAVPPPQYAPQPVGYPVPSHRGLPPGYHQHDGFFLRLNLGVGFGNSSVDELDASGPAIASGFALGGAVTPNLIIFGEGFSSTIINPTLEVGGAEIETDDVTLAIHGFGPGIAFYTDSNVFLSATIAATVAQLTIENVSGDSDVGFGGNLMVGYEWWVAPQWAIGIAGRFLFSNNKGANNSDESLTTLAGALLFSATMN